MNDLERMRQAQIELRRAAERAEQQVRLGDEYRSAMIDSLGELLALAKHDRLNDACDLGQMLADATGRLIAERYRDGLALGWRLGELFARAELRERQFDHWATDALQKTPLRPLH